MSQLKKCLNCERSMFTPSGFSPPSPGSLMVHSHTQCVECHEQGLPDLAPPRDPNERVITITGEYVTPPTFTFDNKKDSR